MHKRHWPSLICAGIVAALALLPVAHLAMRAAGAGAESLDFLRRPAVWRVFGNSALLALLTTAGSVAIGVPLAWLTTRTDLPWRRFWSVASILPLAIPSYIMAYAFIALLGPKGMAAQWLAPLGVERLPDLYGLPGTAIVITLINYPFVVLSVRAALRRLDPALEEAALGLGVSRRAIFRRVVLPQLRPSIAAGALLVALYTLSDFGAPALMQCRTFTRVIYVESSIDRDSAAMTALTLVVLTLMILAAESFTRGRARYCRPNAATSRPPRAAPLGKWRRFAVAFCALVFAASVGLPVLALIVWLGVGLANNQPLNLRAEWVVNSSLAAALTAVVAVAASLPVAIVGVRTPGKLAGAIDRAAYVGNALPGIVVALALVFFGSRLLSLKGTALEPLGKLYQSLPLLIFAYAIRFLPQAVGCLRTSLLQVNPRLEEAARGLGRSRAYVMATVTLPLLLPGALAGGALVFLTTIKELPITLLLHPTGYDTLVEEIWGASTQGLFAQASPAALLLVAVSAVSIVLILWQERREQNA